jgi:hypothetical protein
VYAVNGLTAKCGNVFIGIENVKMKITHTALSSTEHFSYVRQGCLVKDQNFGNSNKEQKLPAYGNY